MYILDHPSDKLLFCCSSGFLSSRSSSSYLCGSFLSSLSSISCLGGCLFFPLPLVCVVSCWSFFIESFPFLFANAAITGQSVKIDDLLVPLHAAFLRGATLITVACVICAIGNTIPPFFCVSSCTLLQTCFG